jgi:hypothetical protein
MMRISGPFVGMTWIAAAILFAALDSLSSTPGEKSLAEDRAAIKRLYQLDVEATLSGKADDFRKLWNGEAVRLEPGGPAEVGQAVIYANDKREETSRPGAKGLSYKPVINMCRLSMAIEWGYFDASFEQSPTVKPVVFPGKLLRVPQQQTDGSWRFARVMWNELK